VWDRVDGSTARIDVRAELGGHTVTIDGESVGIPELGEISLEALGVLIELHQSGHIAALVSIARRWLAEGE